MSIPIVETKDPKGFVPTPLIGADEVCALLLNLTAGQSVGPCQMPATVLCYVVEGQGHLRVGNEQAKPQTGSLATVPSGAVRAISASARMHMPAVQIP